MEPWCTRERCEVHTERSAAIQICQRLISCLLLGLVCASTGPGAFLATSAPADLEGTWEGFIAETPARLTYVEVELKRAGNRWVGTIDLPGARGLPLSAIQFDGLDLKFELRVGDVVVVFDARYAARSIPGRVIENEQAYMFDLQQLPVYPEPDSRVEAWKQDLDVVSSRFLRYDRSFSARTRAMFEQAMDRLEGSLPRLNDEEIIVALSEAVALSGNAHTRLYLLRNRTELRRLPVRVHWFDDGLFVIKATGRLRETLGGRVASIAGRDPRKVKKRVARLFAGNRSWVDYKSPYFLTSPEILYGLGMISDMKRVPFLFDCPEHTPFQRDLVPLPLQRTKKATEAWHALSPGWHGDGAGWTSALPADESTPLYLRHADRHYWFEYLTGRKALYLQYNRSEDMQEGASFSDVAGDVESLVGRAPIETFVLDLRFNTGGDNGIAASFMERLVTLEKEKKIGKLMVIIGRATFSAGISHAAYLKQYSDAMFVGEPIGDELDTWSEGGNIVLPNSGLTVHFTNGFHSHSDVKHPEFEQYKWSDLDLDSLDPDILVRTTSEDYLSGRDPVLDVVLEQGMRSRNKKSRRR